MQLHPTRVTFHVGLSGVVMVAFAVAFKMPAVIAFGGAVLLAVLLGRALALTSVTKIRGSGFEMVWAMPRRVSRLAREGEVTLTCELRNRGVDDARGVNLRAVSSSMLEVTMKPNEVDLPAGARVEVDLVVRAKRVGRWGVHGVALEVRGTPVGGEGLYEVPLMFANPHGIEVFPRSLLTYIESPRGGRSRRGAEAGRPMTLAGDSDEIKELREHVPGDAFKRIAWKASARRGQLVVREMERDERDTVWLVLDASVDLWAGPSGHAPLDAAVDELGSLAARHLLRGDQVGLVVLASRLRTWLAPSNGAGHALRIAAALASAASMVDSDRTALDEGELAQRVIEHARPLDANGLNDVPRTDIDRLAARADTLRQKAPFSPRQPFAKTLREQRLRHYLASFGIEVPPRAEGERDRAELLTARVLERLITEKKRPSVVHLWGPVPTKIDAVRSSVKRLRKRQAEVRWTLPLYEDSVPETASDLGDSADDVARIVRDAVRIRARAAEDRAIIVLRKLGVRVHAVNHRGVLASSFYEPGPTRRRGVA